MFGGSVVEFSLLGTVARHGGTAARSWWCKLSASRRCLAPVDRDRPIRGDGEAALSNQIKVR